MPHHDVPPPLPLELSFVFVFVSRLKGGNQRWQGGSLLDVTDERTCLLERRLDVREQLLPSSPAQCGVTVPHPQTAVSDGPDNNRKGVESQLWGVILPPLRGVCAQVRGWHECVWLRKACEKDCASLCMCFTAEAALPLSSSEYKRHVAASSATLHAIMGKSPSLIQHTHTHTRRVYSLHEEALICHAEALNGTIVVSNQTNSWVLQTELPDRLQALLWFLYFCVLEFLHIPEDQC